MDTLSILSNQDTLSIPSQKDKGFIEPSQKDSPSNCHFLLGKWNIYYHLPHDKNWDLSGYKIIMESVETAEQVILLNDILNENVVKHSMLFIMRTGITPMWEDPRNRNGGSFSYKVINKSVYDVWRSLFFSLCGETLCIDPKHNKHINGITISPKKNFCIIKIWMDTIEYQDPNMIAQLPNLIKQGCLFKKHEPEF